MAKRASKIYPQRGDVIENLGELDAVPRSPEYAPPGPFGRRAPKDLPPPETTMLSNRGAMQDSEHDAEDLVRIFHAREPRGREELSFSWPKTMVEIGAGQAEMYTSDKWQDNGATEDYKHIAEAPRLTFAVPGALRDESGDELPIVGEEIELERPMPRHIAVLGDLIGVQIRLFEERDDGAIVLPVGDDALYEARIRHGKLAASRHPTTDEPFLVVYTASDGVLMIITGHELRIEPEGIAG